MESKERETDEGEDRESLLARSSTTVKEKEEGEEGSTLPDLFFFFAVVVLKHILYPVLVPGMALLFLSPLNGSSSLGRTVHCEHFEV